MRRIIDVYRNQEAVGKITIEDERQQDKRQHNEEHALVEAA